MSNGEAIKKEDIVGYLVTNKVRKETRLQEKPLDDLPYNRQRFEWEPLVRASTLEALQRENARLRNKVDARALTDQQLDDEIAAVSKACEGGFGEGGGSPGEWWYERADELEHERKRRELENQLERHNSRTALASAGEHHAE